MLRKHLNSNFKLKIKFISQRPGIFFGQCSVKDSAAEPNPFPNLKVYAAPESIVKYGFRCRRGLESKHYTGTGISIVQNYRSKTNICFTSYENVFLLCCLHEMFVSQFKRKVYKGLGPNIVCLQNLYSNPNKKLLYIQILTKYCRVRNTSWIPG
jgi:hypothetical protein